MKSKEMENFLEGLSKSLFGRSRKENACITCGSNYIKREDFNSDLSWREFQISRMCQKCQDSTFNQDEKCT